MHGNTSTSKHSQTIKRIVERRYARSESPYTAHRREFDITSKDGSASPSKGPQAWTKNRA